MLVRLSLLVYIGRTLMVQTLPKVRPVIRLERGGVWGRAITTTPGQTPRTVQLYG